VAGARWGRCRGRRPVRGRVLRGCLGVCLHRIHDDAARRPPSGVGRRERARPHPGGEFAQPPARVDQRRDPGRGERLPALSADFGDRARRAGDLARPAPVVLLPRTSARPPRELTAYTNCTAMPPSAPKSACSVSPFWACTTRVKEPASTRWPGSSVTPWLPSLLASHATPSAGWPSTPAATPVSSISEFLYMMPPTQRRSTSSGLTGRPP